VVAKEMTPHGKRSGQIPEILDGFGKAMKAGVATDYENKDKLLPLAPGVFKITQPNSRRLRAMWKE
jgi:hypothetical protein